jgi:hypothetical protein
VSFVAPVGASCPPSRPGGCASRPASADALTASARAQALARAEEFRQKRAKVGGQRPPSPSPTNQAGTATQSSSYSASQVPPPRRAT